MGYPGHAQVTWSTVSKRVAVRKAITKGEKVVGVHAVHPRPDACSILPVLSVLSSCSIRDSTMAAESAWQDINRAVMDI